MDTPPVISTPKPTVAESPAAPATPVAEPTADVPPTPEPQTAGLTPPDDSAAVTPSNDSTAGEPMGDDAAEALSTASASPPSKTLDDEANPADTPPPH